MVSLKAVEAMLEVCAPGYSMEPKLHNRFIRIPSGRMFRNLPKKHDEFPEGMIRKMCRSLEIEECAQQHLPQVYPKKKETAEDKKLQADKNGEPENPPPDESENETREE